MCARCCVLQGPQIVARMRARCCVCVLCGVFKYLHACVLAAAIRRAFERGFALRAPQPTCGSSQGSMAASLVENIRLDMVQVGTYLQSISPQHQASAQENQYQSIMNRLWALQGTGAISLQQATGLQNAKREGPWNLAQSEGLQEAIDSLTGVARQQSRVRRPYQYCPWFANYLSEVEWKALKGPAMKSAKVAQLASRAWSIGITTPAEKTSFHIAEILCYCHQIDGVEAQHPAYEGIKAAIKELDGSRR